MIITEKDVKRFGTKYAVNEETDCWEWQAGIGTQGYGRFKIQQPEPRTVYAHRVSFVMHAGAIPEGSLVLHKCDNRRCVNPAHLFLGSQLDNMQDMAKKGRDINRVGSKNPNAKLSDTDVFDIYDFYEKTKSTLKVAAEWNITKNMAWLIVRGKQWKHLFKQRYGK